jgi:transposase
LEVKKFIEQIKEIPVERLVYLDESGADDNITFTHGYTFKGERCYGKKEFRHKVMVSKIAALRNKSLFAPFVFTGHCNSSLLETYLQNVLLPQLSRGDVVVMDNISFYKQESVKLLIESVGTTILFIPPYCPNLNLIEHYWHKVKQNIRKIKHNFKDFFDCVCTAINFSIP